MKKGKKFIIGIVLITFGVVGLFGLFGNTDDKAALAGGSVLLIAGGAALVYLDKKNPATATKNTVSAPAPAIVPAANVAPAPAAEKKSVPDGEKNYNLFEDVTDGAALCYEYEESLCLFDGAFDHIPGNGGKALTFKQEPENPHDEKRSPCILTGQKSDISIAERFKICSTITQSAAGVCPVISTNIRSAIIKPHTRSAFISRSIYSNRSVFPSRKSKRKLMNIQRVKIIC